MLKVRAISYVRSICLRSLSKTRKPLFVQPVGEQIFELGYPEFEKETLTFRRRRKSTVCELYSEDDGIESQLVQMQS